MTELPSLKGLSSSETYEMIPEDTFLLGYRGSIAHGMYVPKSNPNSIDDKDILGVCFGPRDVYFGLGSFEQREKFIREWDSVVYEVRKFVRLLLKANPNILGLLWLEPVHYITVTPAGRLLIENRALFSTQEAYFAFTGYAHGQLHKMTHGAFQGYMGDKRKQLVEKYGYDTKNAAHLIRLLRMGIEMLKTGELLVQRHDATQLLEIKNGEWPLQKVHDEADALFKRAQAAFDDCKLPRRPNFDEVNKLLCNMVEEHFRVVENDPGEAIFNDR